MNSYTPAPWFLDFEDGSITDKDGFGIAHVTPHGNINTSIRCGETFNSTDGILITASPDLFDACKKALTLESLCPNNDEIFNEIRNAIKKATEREIND